jgi:hypothetical protein
MATCHRWFTGLAVCTTGIATPNCEVHPRWARLHAARKLGFPKPGSCVADSHRIAFYCGAAFEFATILLS